MTRKGWTEIEPSPLGHYPHGAWRHDLGAMVAQRADGWWEVHLRPVPRPVFKSRIAAMELVEFVEGHGPEDR